jgi:hypothetical protein
MSRPPGRDQDELDFPLVPLGPVVDVSVCSIGLLAIRYSPERPPRFVFLLENAQSDWLQESVH